MFSGEIEKGFSEILGVSGGKIFEKGECIELVTLYTYSYLAGLNAGTARLTN